MDYWYTALFFDVKCNIVSEHLPDDSDKFAGTVPKGIVVSPVFSFSGIIISPTVIDAEKLLCENS